MGAGSAVVLGSCSVTMLAQGVIGRPARFAREVVLSAAGAAMMLTIALYIAGGLPGGESLAASMALLAIYGAVGALAIRYWAALVEGGEREGSVFVVPNQVLVVLAILLTAALLLAFVLPGKAFVPAVGSAGLLAVVVGLAIHRGGPCETLRSESASKGKRVLARIHPLPVALGMVITWIAYGFSLVVIIPRCHTLWLVFAAPISLVLAQILTTTVVLPRGVARNSFVLTRLMLPFFICVVAAAPFAYNGAADGLCLAVLFAFAVSLKVIIASHYEILIHTQESAFGVVANAVAKCTGGLALGIVAVMLATQVSDGLRLASLLVGVLLALNCSFLLADRNSLPVWRKNRTKSDVMDESVREISGQFGLSERETDILRLLSDGLNAASIADSLCISVHTVKTHMKRIYIKMDVHTQQELMNRVRALADDLGRVES